MPRGNPFLKKKKKKPLGRDKARGSRGARPSAADTFLGGEEGRAGQQDDPSSRMNFAAQLLYSSYLSERLQRLYSPRPALKDTEENDPFWQRWELRVRPEIRPPPFNLSLPPVRPSSAPY